MLEFKNIERDLQGSKDTAEYRGDEFKMSQLEDVVVKRKRAQEMDMVMSGEYEDYSEGNN